MSEYLKKLDGFENKDNVILLTYGGSTAYGLETPTSDIDLRGVCLNTKEQLLKMEVNQSCYSVVDKEEDKDVVIYYLKDFIELAKASNPNIIEIFGCNAEHYHVLTPAGKLLLDNVDLFLSKKIILSFSGFANDQMRRLQNALAKGDGVADKTREEHIKASVQGSFKHLAEHYANFSADKIDLFVDTSDRDDTTHEIKMNMSLENYPLREFYAIQQAMGGIVRGYDKYRKVKKENSMSKDIAKLRKHAMHLIRVKQMLLNILEGKGVKTYVDNREELMNIRNGITDFDKVFELNEELSRKIDEAALTCNLPDVCDSEKIDELVIKLNSFVLY